MYAGIRPCKAINVNWLLNSICSQCKDPRIGEAWDQLIEAVLLKQVNRELQNMSDYLPLSSWYDDPKFKNISTQFIRMELETNIRHPIFC